MDKQNVLLFFLSRLWKPFLKTFYHIESCCPRPNGRNQNHINNKRMLYELMSEQTVLTLSCPYKKLMIPLSVHFNVSIKKKSQHINKKKAFFPLFFLSIHAILYLRVLLWSLMPCLAVLISKNNSKLKLFAVGWVASRLHGGRHVVMNSAHRTRWFIKSRLKKKNSSGLKI